MLSPLATPPGRLYNIPAGAPFTRALAQWLLQSHLDVAQAFIFLPNTKSCAAIKEALCALSHTFIVQMPKIFCLGHLSASTDLMPYALLDQETPKIQSFKAFKNNLVSEFLAVEEHQFHPQTIESFINIFTLSIKEEVDWRCQEHLFPEHLAHHKQMAFKQLELLLSITTDSIAQNGLIPPLYEKWFQDKVSAHLNLLKRPIILAGTTASQPMTWRLMQAVLNHPQGYVILPGFDHDMYDQDKGCLLPLIHHQAIMHKRVHDLSLAPVNIQTDQYRWQIERAQNVSYHLFPEYHQQKNLSKSQGFDHFHIGITSSEHEEKSLIIALIKKTLHHNPSASIGLVLPQDKIETYTMLLKASNIDVCASSRSLMGNAVLAKVIFHLLSLAQNPDVPSTWLCILKSLVRMKKRPDLIPLIEQFEIKELRRFKTIHWSGLFTFLCKDGAEMIQPFVQWVLQHHDQMYPPQKWASLLLNLLKETIPPDPLLDDIQLSLMQISQWSLNKILNAESFYPLIQYILQFDGKEAQDQKAASKVYLLNSLEIRLLTFDLLIISHFNDKHWPRRSAYNPWLNEKQMQSLGFMPSDTMIGQSAHDFIHSFASKEVFLTRSQYENGTPTHPSPWLLRLKASLGQHAFNQLCAGPAALIEQYKQLTLSLKIKNPAQLVTRVRCHNQHKPTIISATRFERLIQNPFHFFIAQILGIQELQPLYCRVTPSRLGTLVHEIMDYFIKQGDFSWLSLTKLAQKTILNYPLNQIHRYRLMITLKALHYKLAQEKDNILHMATESENRMDFKMNQHIFCLTAKSDRIDTYKDQTQRVIDYKTGAIPSIKDIEDLQSVQLLFTAYILSQSTAPGSTALPTPPYALEYRQAKLGASSLKSTSLTGEALKNTLRQFETVLHEILEQYMMEDYAFDYKPQERHGYDPIAHLAQHMYDL